MVVDPARRIAQAAAALAVHERGAFLDSACAGDPALRRLAEQLLEAADADTDQLSTIVSARRMRPLPVAPWSCGNYLAEREVGRGGTGTVFAGVDTRDGRRVALKVLHLHLLDTADALERFGREFELGRRVAHENVVRALDALEVDGPAGTLHVLVTEWIEGPTLRSLLGELGRVPETLVREAARQVAAGLAAIHDAGIVHRDVKPENIVLTADGRRACLMDLGIARMVETSQPLTQAGQFLGTLAYAAPEQFEGSAVGPAADLHALGTVMLELLTGVNPFRRDTPAATVHAVLAEMPPRAVDLVPDVSDLLDELVASLLQKDPAARPTPAGLVQRVLEEAESGRWWLERRTTLAAARSPRVPVARDAPLRGRDRELELLLHAWERARGGRGGTVFVEGEAGLGKSRLLSELLQAAAGTGRLLYGAFPPTRGVGGIVSALSDIFVPERFEPELRAMLPDSPAVVARLVALARGEVAHLAMPSATGSVLAADVAELARALASRGPVLWVLDDLHAGSSEAGVVARELARVAASASLLVVIASRPQSGESAKADLLALPAVELLRLPRLDAEQVEDLIADLLGDRVIAQHLAGDVAQRADGVPFFVFELLRGLRETGVIVTDARGAWHLGRPIDDAPIPDRVREMVQARLDELEPVDRIILDVASLCGSAFDAAVVARALDLPLVQVLQNLARLERGASLVRAQGRRHRFEHQLVREVVEEALPPALAEQYHGLLGDALAAAERPSSADRWRLLRHQLSGPRPHEALPCLAAVVDELERASRREQAAEACDLALSREGLLEGPARADMLLRLGALLHVLGRRARQREAGEQALATAQAAGDVTRQVRAGLALAALEVALHDNEAALARVREAARLARASGDEPLTLEAACTEGATLVNQGRHAEGTSVLREVVASAARLGAPQREATARISLGLAALREGRHADAREELERAGDLAKAADARGLATQADGNLAVIALLQGRRADASVRLGRVLATARETGDRRMEALACGHLGQAAIDDGRLSHALELFGRERALAEEVGDRPAVASSLAETAVIHAARGDAATARELAAEVGALAKDLPHPRLQGFLRIRLARVAWLLGDALSAARELESAVAVAEQGGDRAGAAEALADRAAALLVLEHPDEARDAARRAAELARASDACGALHLACALLAALDAPRAAEHAATASTMRERATWLQALAASFVLAAAERGSREAAQALVAAAQQGEPGPARDAIEACAGRMRGALSHALAALRRSGGAS